jgi:1-acyl-sn-glycerol-3-phosphate acyltransferase
MEDDRLVQRSVTDEIMYELMRLSGQEYVDEYAAVVKLRLAGKAHEATPDKASAGPDAVPDAAADTAPVITPDITPDDVQNPGAPTAAAEDGPEAPGTA